MTARMTDRLGVWRSVDLIVCRDIRGTWDIAER